MSKAFWISRDVREHSGTRFYVVSRKKTKCDEDGNFCGDADLCDKEFEMITGITIEPGQQKKFKLVQQGR